VEGRDRLAAPSREPPQLQQQGASLPPLPSGQAHGRLCPGGRGRTGAGLAQRRSDVERQVVRFRASHEQPEQSLLREGMAVGRLAVAKVERLGRREIACRERRLTLGEGPGALDGRQEIVAELQVRPGVRLKDQVKGPVRLGQAREPGVGEVRHSEAARGHRAPDRWRHGVEADGEPSKSGRAGQPK
jgi:hypothetical protein